jgi:hypothetical protein
MIPMFYRFTPLVVAGALAAFVLIPLHPAVAADQPASMNARLK